MSRAAQVWRDSAQKWLPRDLKQSLYWVVAVFCALLIVVKTHSLIVSRSAVAPVSAIATNQPSASAESQSVPSAEGIAATVPEERGAEVARSAAEAPIAAPQHNSNVDSSAKLGDVTIVAQGTGHDASPSFDDASLAESRSPRDDESSANEKAPVAPQSEPAYARLASPPAEDDPGTVARVFAALGGVATETTTGDLNVDVGEAGQPPQLFAIVRREVDRRAGRFQDRDGRGRAFVMLFGAPVPAESAARSSPSEFTDRTADNDAVTQSTPLTTDPVAENAPEVAGHPPAVANSAAAAPAFVESAISSGGETAMPSADAAARQDDVAASAGTAEVAELPAAELVIVNPLENGGVVLYLIDGEMFSLSPGESQRLSTDRDRRIAFHRGETFGDSQSVLRSGRYAFRVGAQGWELVADQQDGPR